jgi:hypothetical protein
MKKLLTLALALALVALGSVSGATTSLNSSRKMQKKPPETMASNLNSSRSNVYRVMVKQVNEKDNTFAVEVNFSAKNLKGPLPEVGKIIYIAYNPPTPGGTMEAVAQSSDNGTMTSYRAATTIKVVNGTVTQVDAKSKTFAVKVTFSGAELNALPEVGKTYDITFQTTPDGTLKATATNTSRSNSF